MIFADKVMLLAIVSLGDAEPSKSVVGDDAYVALPRTVGDGAPTAPSQ